MKFGISIVKTDSQLILEPIEMELEDIMVKYSIEDSQNVWIASQAYELKFIKELFEAIYINSFFRYGYQPKINHIDEYKRNLPSDLNLCRLLPLISVIEDKLPDPPKLKSNGNQCHNKCGQTFPEPDGFGGVYVQSTKINKEILICFKCYQQNNF